MPTTAGPRGATAPSPVEGASSDGPGAAPPASRPLSRRDTRAQARAVRVLDGAAAALGWGAWDGAPEFDDLDLALEALDLVAAVLAERVRLAVPDDPELPEAPGTGRLALLALEVEGARRDLREQKLGEQEEALVGVQSGLSRLHGIGSAASMLDRATEEVCRSCGFDRSILFRVLDAQMVAVSVFYRGDPAGAAQLLEVGRHNPVGLDHMLLETEMIRRRIPMLVADAQHDPRVHRAIADASGSASYVAAPIMPEGQVIGFLHADRHFQRRSVDLFDRQLLWAFAEGFGYALQGTVLLERIRAQREQVRGMIRSTEQLMDELCEAEDAYGSTPATAGGFEGAGGRAASMVTGGPSRLDQLLTRREIEVIRLMAGGETNAAIADRLVISEGTVKSHVKHILRKLRAANRAEAVSRYLRITALDADG